MTFASKICEITEVWGIQNGGDHAIMRHLKVRFLLYLQNSIGLCSNNLNMHQLGSLFLHSIL